MNRRYKFWIGAVAVLATIGGSAACGAMAPSSPTSAQPQTQSQILSASSSVTAEGVVVPVREAALSFLAGGVLQELTVREGEAVAEGALLASLDMAELELAVQEARDGLALQEAMLVQAKAGARQEELAIARAEYQRALAQYEQLRAGARPEEVAMAEADLQAALAHQKRVQSGADEQELIAAKASMERAKVALDHAQAEYDKYAWQQGFQASPQAAALHQATIDYQSAQAQYERLKSIPHDADLQEAAANLSRAEAQLRLRQAGPTEQELAASAAGVAGAEAQLALREAGPRPEDVAVAETRVQQARTALERAELALSRAHMLAPFSGTVIEIAFEEGEAVSVGVPVVTLADLAELQVKTTDLDEWATADVHVGQAAKVFINAFEDKVLPGRVVAIATRGNILDTGDTAYTATIALDRQDPDLRWGMTAKVEFLEE